MKKIVRRILKSIAVECRDEFDRNFDRQAFFSRSWQRRKSPINARYKTLHGPQSTLRRSLMAHVEDGAVVFSTDLPYAAIHNEGGEIPVTARMKRYFWARYYEANGGMGRKKSGELRQTKENRRLSTEADFWKAMALMKVGQRIRIPQRQFLGWSPEIGKAVEEIISEELDRWDYMK